MRKKVVAAACTAATVLTVTGVAQAQALNVIPDVVRTLDGSGNNVAHPTWGQDEHAVLRVAPANYADGIKKPVAGPPTRYVSNRIFNDTNQNLFSENGVTQWGFTWGQFLDHTFGLRVGERRRERPDRVHRNRSAGELHQHARRREHDGVHPHPGRARDGRRQRRAPADQHRQQLHRRVRRLRRPTTRGWSGCARARSTGTWPTTEPSCCWPRTARCPAGRPAATPRRRPRWGSRARSPSPPARRWWPVTCGRTRTWPSRPPTRCSRRSTTGSSTRSHGRSERRPGSRSRAAWSAPSSSSSPTTSSCPAWAWRCRRTAATSRTSTRASGTSSRSPATGRTA